MGNQVSYNDKTYMDSKKYREGLEALEKKVSLAVLRYYLQSKQKDPTISAEVYDEIDALAELRSGAIKREMLYANAQAELAGITLPEDVQEGTNLSIGFKKEITDKVPSLGVYQLFMPYSQKELEALLDQTRNEKPKEKDSNGNVLEGNKTGDAFEK